MGRMIELDGRRLTVRAAEEIVFRGVEVRPTEESLERVEEGFRAVRRAVARGERIYGVSTGLGKLSEVPIPREGQRRLQENLLRSHAVAVGEPLPDEASRAALLFRLNSLLLGHSGVRREVIHYLVKLLNHQVYPSIPAKGSVGASGDLAPLAHLALILIGEGEAKLSRDGELLPGKEVLRRLRLEPLELEPKEGLALINGTQVSLAVGFLALVRARKLLEGAQLLSALALEAYGGKTEPYDERFHWARPHPGQLEVAARIRDLLRGSRLVDPDSSNGSVQDPYSLRCVPQVLGASAEVVEFVKGKIEIEMNSATDNPLVFPETGEILSGGNFHGQPLALAFELLAQATAEIGSLAERQLNLILNAPGLPRFLAEEPGSNSGLMLLQYTAAALVSENKVLAHPAAVDSIPTSGGIEDHNSLCSISAYKALKIVENVEQILALELLALAQALDFREASKMAPATSKAYGAIRDRITHLAADRIMGEDIKKAVELIREGLKG
ncbi:TPA: histidine ammonia-lyase [Candidatus Bipolaricaulota bacterium]|nr:histidine ammonia-lyase [Candidatus Bipolaricaulota bacterium]